MDIKTFLDALSVIASSPYALVGYALVVIVWGISLWNTRKLQIIGERLKDLPEKDRLKALQLEYKLIPKEGLDSKSFLAMRAQQYKLAIVLAFVLAAVLISCLATYRAIEGEKLSSALRSMSIALEVTKLGKISADNNQYAVAAGNLEAALQAYPTAVGYISLGYIYDELSNTDAAIVAYKKANEMNPSVSDIHNALGYLYKDAGRYELALTHLEKARSLSTPGDDTWFMATANAGNVLYEIGRKTNIPGDRSKQCEKAINEYFLPALEYRGAIKNQNLVASTLANLANCYKDTNRFADAKRAMEDAISIKRRVNANRSLADTLVNMADLLLKEKRYEEAKPYLVEAVSIFLIVQNHLGLGAAYFNLGDIMWVQGKENEAKSYYEQSIEAFSIAHVGGEYDQAPRRRLERMKNGNPPEFVKKPKGA
ncbi:MULTISPECIES: tetratricopeptide repeat protein [unclassified Pseudomonas]|uniref:tetratricopeptide repeat protein n=1 Tax=unclassified Pseudomonas TaxID=196821 RepID=UPI00101F027E|nr:tetratricopeptide repeat protein [Pseudomonas sp. SWI36]